MKSTNAAPQPWLDHGADNRRFLAALGIALVLEASVFLFLLPAVTHQPPPAEKQSVVKLTMLAPPAPPKPPAPKPLPKPQPPPPVPQPPKPVPPPKPQPVAPPKPPPPAPVHHSAPRHIVHHQPPPRPVPPPQVPTPPVQQAPPQPPVAPAPQQPAPPPQGEVDQFRLAMRQAVQASANQAYPQAAQMARQSGQPVVEFTYRDGVISAITLLQSCGIPSLDAAALQAVRIAHYPPEPADFHGQTEQVQVLVIFRPAEATEDGD